MRETHNLWAVSRAAASPAHLFGEAYRLEVCSDRIRGRDDLRDRGEWEERGRWKVGGQAQLSATAEGAWSKAMKLFSLSSSLFLSISLSLLSLYSLHSCTSVGFTSSPRLRNFST
jgi:hypothetical protein